MGIITLLDHGGIKLTRRSGREFSAPCPFCGGRDRFRVWPDDKGGMGSFWCRVCGKRGDAVQYHILTTGKRYFDACHDLGVTPRSGPRKRDPDDPERILPPPLVWRQQAAEFVEKTVSILWQERGLEVREYLHHRGINDRSMRSTKLGLNPIDRWFDRSSWGLPAGTTEHGKPKQLWIPAGLVIPWTVGGDVHRIRIRRMDATEPRYVIVSGSTKQPLRLGQLNRVVVVESDLDGILISQQAGDLVSAVSLGSVSLRPDQETHKHLRTAEVILLALDADEAGARNVSWWKEQFGDKVKRWPVPVGKDPGEAFRAGVDIRAWIKAGMDK